MKRYVEMMEGTITVESELGQGSEFIIHLPLKVAQEEELDEIIVPLTEKELEGKKVMLVDSSETSLRLMNAICDQYKMNITASRRTSHAAWSWLSQCHESSLPDVIVYNFMIEDRKQCDLLGKIRSHHRLSSVKVIGLPSDDGVSSLARAQQEGCDSFLTKPIVDIKMLVILQTTLGQSGSMEQIVSRHVLDEMSCAGTKILLVEDNFVNQKLAKALLDKLECDVVIASNGLEAINEIKAQKFDICLMDLQMPEMGGIEATKIIRQDLYKKLPLLP